MRVRKYVDDYEHSGDIDNEKAIMRRIGCRNMTVTMERDGEVQPFIDADFDGTQDEFEDKFYAEC